MLIYDGDCAFCRRTLRWARGLGATCEMRASSDVDLAALGLTPADTAAAAWYVDGSARSARRWAGHEAIAMALLSSRWALVRVVGRVVGSRPLRPVAGRAYAWVADHRSQLERFFVRVGRQRA